MSAEIVAYNGVLNIRGKQIIHTAVTQSDRVRRSFTVLKQKRRAAHEQRTVISPLSLLKSRVRARYSPDWSFSIMVSTQDSHSTRGASPVRPFLFPHYRPTESDKSILSLYTVLTNSYSFTVRDELIKCFIRRNMFNYNTTHLADHTYLPQLIMDSFPRLLQT